MRTYVQTAAFDGECDNCGASSAKVADVHSSVTDEVLVTLCDECLDEEGWL